eukprot:4850489-Amphidinium_carterae.1
MKEVYCCVGLPQTLHKTQPVLGVPVGKGTRHLARDAARPKIIACLLEKFVETIWGEALSLQLSSVWLEEEVLTMKDRQTGEMKRETVKRQHACACETRGFSHSPRESVGLESGLSSPL